MGILVSALIGIALTLPISSAAICIAPFLDGLAGRGYHGRLLRAEWSVCDHERATVRIKIPGPDGPGLTPACFEWAASS